MAESPTHADRTDIVRDAVQKGLSKGDTEYLQTVFADEVELIDEDDTIGRDQLLSTLQSFDHAFPDFSYTIRSIWNDGDVVIVHYEGTGIFENDFDIEEGTYAGIEIPANGEEIEGSGVYLARVSDGKIVGWNNHTDALQTFQQMGLVPDLEDLAG